MLCNLVKISCAILASNPNPPAVKKVYGPQECCCEKICEIQSGGQEMAVMVG